MSIIKASIIHQNVVATARGHPVANSIPISLQKVIIQKLITSKSEEYPKITNKNDGRSSFWLSWSFRLSESQTKRVTIANIDLIICQLVNIPPIFQKCSLLATFGARFETRNRNDGINPMASKTQPNLRSPLLILSLEVELAYETRRNAGRIKNIKRASSLDNSSSRTSKTATTTEITE